MRNNKRSFFLSLTNKNNIKHFSYYFLYTKFEEVKLQHREKVLRNIFLSNHTSLFSGLPLLVLNKIDNTLFLSFEDLSFYFYFIRI